MGTRLSDHRPAGTRPACGHPPGLPGWPQAGRATTLPAREGLAYCRIDGLVGALPAPKTPLFSGLLGEYRDYVVACQYGNAMGAQRCTGAELNVYLSREETERQILATYGPRSQ